MTRAEAQAIHRCTTGRKVHYLGLEGRIYVSDDPEAGSGGQEFATPDEIIMRLLRSLGFLRLPVGMDFEDE